MTDEPRIAEWRPTCLVLVPGLSFEEWQSTWNSLDQTERSINWLIGDCLLYGEDNWPEEWAQVVEGRYSEKRRGALWVSRRIPPAERRENLSWSAHRETAALEPAERRELLNMAEREKWGTREIVIEIRRRKEAVRATQPGYNGGPLLDDVLVRDVDADEEDDPAPTPPVSPDLDRRRTAFAEALAAELGLDLNPEFMAAADRVLTRLYLFGYIISEIPK